MAKLSKEDLEQIVRNDLPGFKVSQKSRAAKTAEGADARNAGADASRAESLRRKYLGGDAAADDDDDNDASGLTDWAARGTDNNPGDDDDTDDEVIVAVEPETSNHPWDRSARPKAAVISKKEKKVIGQQG